MVLIEENTVIDLINELGSDVTLRRFSGDTFNTRGDVIEGTATDLEIKALVDYKGGETDFEREGTFNPDSKAFFISGSLNVSKGDIIIHRENEYKINNIKSAELENFVHVHEVITSIVN